MLQLRLLINKKERMYIKEKDDRVLIVYIFLTTQKYSGVWACIIVEVRFNHTEYRETWIFISFMSLNDIYKICKTDQELV